MRKFLLVIVAAFMMMACTGCGEKAKQVAGFVDDHKEAIYNTGKKVVQTLVPEETREKLHTKDIDKAVTTGYGIYKDVKNSEKK